MAVAFVKGKHTKGNESLNKIVVTATAANMLVAIISQSNSLLEPKFSDNLGGAWVVNATSCAVNTTGSIWLATKKAVGTETEIKGEPGVGGTVVGMAYSEVSGSSEAVDKIVATPNIASSKEGTTSAYTNTDSDAYLMVVCGSLGTQGTDEAWTGTGAALTNDEVAIASRVFIGHAVLTEAQVAKTWTAHHSTAATMGLLAVTFKATSGAVVSPETMIV